MISIVVCTFNRCDALSKSLEAIEAAMAQLATQRDIESELIVADNNSTDQTASVIKEAADKSSLTIRYVFEAKQGSSYARNAGIEQARGNVIAFADDDCLPDKDWLVAMHDHYAADAKLGLLGGRVELYNPLDKPVTIRTFPETEIYTKPGDLFYLIPGCNMSARREVFAEIGLFDGRLGAGAKGLAAEDSDFIYRVAKQGWGIRYEPDVMLWHDHGRRTDEAIAKLDRNYIFGRGAFYAKYLLRLDSAIARMAYWEFRNLFFKRPLLGEGRLKIIGRLCRGMGFMLWAETKRVLTGKSISM